MFFRMAAFVASAALIGTAQVAPVFANSDDGHSGANQLKRIKHIVVIYQENHSFDNLYGGWEGVNGLRDADAAHTIQVNQAGSRLHLPAAERRQPRRRRRCRPTCTDTTTGTPFTSHFPNAPFAIDDFIPPTRHDLPARRASSPPTAC